jgi:hypothetical protein
MWESERPLLYGKPCQAVQLRLTEKMWEAIQVAKKTGGAISMNLGDMNVRISLLNAFRHNLIPLSSV